MARFRRTPKEVARAKLQHLISDAITNNETTLNSQKSIEDTKEQVLSLSKKLDDLTRLLQADYDGVNDLRRLLYTMRLREEYTHAFSNKKPLISVRIATYNRGKTLVSRAIQSVLQQTYQNFEVIVVGDHCTDDTEKLINEVNDERIRFYNLPYHSPQPKDPIKKWYSIGSNTMNVANSLCKGVWIAPLDDDDEFTSDHLKKLLDQVLESKCEMAYGATIQHNIVTGGKKEIWSFPPERGEFTFMGTLYLRMLSDIFQYDTSSWVMEEPQDWNLCRKMMEAGVFMSGIQDNVGNIYMVPVDQKEKLGKKNNATRK
jgi:hypothetical protein